MSGVKILRIKNFAGYVDENSESERSEVPCAAYPMDINL